MKIFGDDGFRDIANSGLMNEAFLNNFFNSLNYFLNKKNISRIYIGYDTRKSYQDILNIIKKNIKVVNEIKIFNRPVTTPYSHFISMKKKAFIIMITASHFEPKFNGFKFFNSGEKLSKIDEKFIIKKLNQKKIFYNSKKVKISKIFYKDYEKFINRNFKFQINKKILFDYSNGSAVTFKNNINFLKKSRKTSIKYNGKNINLNSGSEYLKKNFIKYSKTNDYVIAFDGDADRVVIAKKKYGIIETEKLALIFLTYLKNKNFTKNNVIVGTEIVNPWLKKQIQNLDMMLKISKVGDRNVINEIKKNNALFGFETSGHFSFNNMMDGIYTSGLFLEILNKKPLIIEQVLSLNIDFKQIIIGIERNKIIKIKKCLSLLKKNLYIKFILRKSIWNHYFKIYIFFKDKNILFANNYFKKIISNSIEQKIKN